jgi:beta-lactamase class A
MGAAAGQAREHDAGRSWTGALVASAVCLVLAAFYLALSVDQAINRHERSPLARALELVPAARDEVTTALDPQSDDATTEESAPAAAEESPPAQSPGAIASNPDAKLLATVQDAIGEDSDHIGVSVKRLTDGRSAQVNGDFQFYAASTFKLAVLYEAELRHARGELAYDDRITMTEEDMEQDLGTAGYLNIADDGSISIADILRPMIEVSDNSSAVALMHFLGTSRIDQTLRGLGIETMTLNSEQLWTTPNDLARLMEAIYRGEGTTDAERANMRDLLLAQTIRGGIPSALGPEIQQGLLVGNKTGTWESAQHDVAFVEDQSGVYVIALLTDGSYDGWEAMHRVARAVQDYFTATP